MAPAIQNTITVRGALTGPIKMDATLEHLRSGAIKGQILDPHLKLLNH